MRNILLFGAGKSATVLIDYLLELAPAEDWHLYLVDANRALAEEKLHGSKHATALSFDINNDQLRAEWIERSDIVISLLPPALHILVARTCVDARRHLLTASYVDDALRALQQEIESNGLLFLCEMGLDPGIDHMSAKKMIDEIQLNGGTISGFLSHCGGLVAPESDNNPWHYKISWNPRNVVNAGKAGAIFKRENELVELKYQELFDEKRFVSVPGLSPFCWYPNRDSLSYIPVYGLESATTFIRTTLRHPDFMYGWKNLLELNLTDDKDMIASEGKSLMNCFKEYMDRNGFSGWIEKKLASHFDSTKNLLAELVNLVELEQKAAEKGIKQVEEFMVVDDNGDLQKVDIDDLKVNAASTLAGQMHDASLTLKQLFFLGLDDANTIVPFAQATAADVLQFALERKLALQPHDKDMVVMLHEIEYKNSDGTFKAVSALVVKGVDDKHTAMAKTVGLPLGIAARLILNGVIRKTGLHIPVSRDIYEPVLKELAAYGIAFSESVQPV